MPPISVLIKPASGLCNLRCRYCFYCDEMAKRDQASFGVMSHETLDVLTEKVLAFAHGQCTFGFQGGEPTLAGLEFFESVIHLQKQYNVHDVQIQNTIQTNGYAVTEPWATFFANHKFLVGLSLDGLEEHHNINRVNVAGEGTFGRVMATAGLFDRLNVDYNILTVVNRQTARDINRIYHFYKERGFRYLQFIPCLDPLGEEPGGQAFSLTPEDYGLFLRELFDLWYDDWCKQQQPYIRMFENYLAHMVGVATESCDMRGTCQNQYVIEADGSVYPCDFYVLDECRLGSILTDGILGLHGNSARFVDASRGWPDRCKACEFFRLCRGGCRRNRIVDGAGKSNNYFCSAYKQFLSHSIKRLKEIAANLCRGD
ncbi:MAG: anaerobic sulfatase maturase [Phycisphaerae bacterium]|nr:anaerobic sulfatase maturase [Phycisphaerae bacterium]